MVVNVHAKSHVGDWGHTGQVSTVTSDADLTTFSIHIPLSHFYCEVIFAFLVILKFSILVKYHFKHYGIIKYLPYSLISKNISQQCFKISPIYASLFLERVL